MIIKNRYISTLLAIFFVTMLIIPLTACDKTPAASTKSVDKGSTWEVPETTTMSELTIAEGAIIKAPKGYSLTMTVDGVETQIEPGSYKGEIVLTVNDEIIVNYRDTKTYQFRTAIYVSDGKYMPEKSVAAAAVGGTVTDTSASDVKITSVGDKFNGIIVTGDSKYSINNTLINMTGNGGNDFAGFGASIMTDGEAEITIENARINNTGVVRPAIWVGGNSTATINNSDIETHSGTLPSDYSFSWVEGSMQKGENFMEVPWMLGCVGNTRATILMANGRAYYNNSHIKAYGWGALSTDGVSSDAILYATNCLIETFESGYGSFADGSSNTYSGCTFNVVDYALIMQRGSAHFTDGTVVNSNRLGVMAYSDFNYSHKLTIDKGCVFNTRKAAIQVKGGAPTITVDNAQLNSESGVILQAMLLDDPDMLREDKGGSSGMPGGGMPGGGMPGGLGSTSSNEVNATFKNMTLNGDIITSMTTERDVVVSLEKSTIKGAITTSIAEHVKGPNGEELTISDDTSLYYIIGEVIDTYSATNDKYGMKVSFDKDSKWVVDETSYLTGLSIADGATITAPKGYTVTLTVDGVETPIKAGTYKGSIVLTVTNF